MMNFLAFSPPFLKTLTLVIKFSDIKLNWNVCKRGIKKSCRHSVEKLVICRIMGRGELRLGKRAKMADQSPTAPTVPHSPPFSSFITPHYSTKIYRPYTVSMGFIFFISVCLGVFFGMKPGWLSLFFPILSNSLSSNVKGKNIERYLDSVLKNTLRKE